MELFNHIFFDNPLRIAIILFTITGIILWPVWGWKHPDRRGYVIAALSWLVHVLIFYIVLTLTNDADPAFFNGWSQIIRLQSLFLVVGSVIVLMLTRKRAKNE